MSEVIAFMVGVVLTALFALLWQKRKSGTRSNGYDYKQLWKNAVILLGDQDRLTQAQIKSITPSEEIRRQRPKRQPGNSWDRAAVEVARAKKSLPPRDNLKEMRSQDRREVLEARIKYGTTD